MDPSLDWRQKKLLVLDLNGLLIDSRHVAKEELKERRPDGRVNQFRVYLRPFCRDFIEFCLTRFVVGIWSSARIHNVKALLAFALPHHAHRFAFIWDQSKCTHSGLHHPLNPQKPLFFKELQLIWSAPSSLPARPPPLPLPPPPPPPFLLQSGYVSFNLPSPPYLPPPFHSWLHAPPAHALPHHQHFERPTGLLFQPSHTLQAAVPEAGGGGGGGRSWGDRWRVTDDSAPRSWEELAPGVGYGGRAHSWARPTAVADAWPYASERHHGSDWGGPRLVQPVGAPASSRRAITASMVHAPHGIDSSSAAVSAHSRPSQQQQQQQQQQGSDGLPWPTGAFGPTNTLLLDDSPYKAALNPPYTAVFLPTYDASDTAADMTLREGNPLWTYLEGVAAAHDVQKFVSRTPFGLPAVYVSCPSELIPLLEAQGGEGEGGKVRNSRQREEEEVRKLGAEAGSGRRGSEAVRQDEVSEGSERSLSEDEGAVEGQAHGDEIENRGVEAKANVVAPTESQIEGKNASAPASVIPINKKRLKRARKAARKAARNAAAAAAAAAAVMAAAGGF